MLNLIPDDLSYIVLSKLPVKSLLRLRCVSKEWLNLIDRPCFINIHLNHSKKYSCNSMFCPLGLFNSPEEIIPMYAFDFDNQDKYMDEAIKILPPTIYSGDDIQTCDGLVCLYNESSITIWNPATHKYRQVPRMGSYFRFGFGYDHKTDDYMVVMLDNYQTFEDKQKVYFVNVYSLRTGLWTRNVTVLENRIPINSVYASGAIHWMTINTENEENYYKCCICALDLSTMSWWPRTMPPEEQAIYPCTWSFVNHQGSLCAGYHRYTINIVDLWIMESQDMKSNSWSKLARVKFDFYYLPTSVPLWSTLKKKKKKKKQVLVTSFNEHDFYDIDQGTTEPFNVLGVPKFYQCFICCQSLVPV